MKFVAWAGVLATVVLPTMARTQDSPKSLRKANIAILRKLESEPIGVFWQGSIHLAKMQFISADKFQGIWPFVMDAVVVAKVCGFEGSPSFVLDDKNIYTLNGLSPRVNVIPASGGMANARKVDEIWAAGQGSPKVPITDVVRHANAICS